MKGSEHSRTTSVRRVLAVAAIATTLLLGASMPAASAHDALARATPADGTSVASAPAEVSLEFTGVVQELGAEVAVSGPDGTAVSLGRGVVVDSTLTQPLAPDLPAGTYTVSWRVTSADGHPISGTSTFTVTADAATSGPVQEASAAQQAGSSSSGPAIGIGAAVVLVLALALAARQLRGRR